MVDVVQENQFEFVVFDMDGTLSEDSWRKAAYAPRTSPIEDPDEAWFAYHNALFQDEPIAWTVAIAKAFADRNFVRKGPRLKIITGRPERFRKITLNWLVEKCSIMLLDEEKDLIMRQPEDKGISSLEYKLKVAEREIGMKEHGNSHILAWAEDDVRVIDALHNRGINVIDASLEGFVLPKSQDEQAKGKSSRVAEILHEMAELYDFKHKKYGNNYKEFEDVMIGLLPGESYSSFQGQWNRLGVFTNIITKISRFSKHFKQNGDQDVKVECLKDLIVYSAMLLELEEPQKPSTKNYDGGV